MLALTAVMIEIGNVMSAVSAPAGLNVGLFGRRLTSDAAELLVVHARRAMIDS